MKYHKEFEDINREPDDLKIGDKVSILRDCDDEASVGEIIAITKRGYRLKDYPHYYFKREELTKLIYIDDLDRYGMRGYVCYYPFKDEHRLMHLGSTKHGIYCESYSVYNFRGKKLCGLGPDKIKLPRKKHYMYVFEHMPKPGAFEGVV